MKLAKIVKVLGHIFLWGGFTLIVIGYVGIVITNGFGALQETLSPFNVWNWIVVMLTLAPGVLLLTWAKKLEGNQQGD